MQSNPNKVNQYTLPDPRQVIFLECYFDRNSDTFGNTRQSALKAGYTQEYGEQLTSRMPAWLFNKVKDADLIDLAEGNLKQSLVQIPEDSTDKNIKHDATKFVLTRLAKERYSERKELSGPNGESLKVPTDESQKLLQAIDG